MLDDASNVNNKAEIKLEVRKEVGLEIKILTWQEAKIRSIPVQQLYVKSNFKIDVSGSKVRNVRTGIGWWRTEVKKCCHYSL